MSDSPKFSQSPSPAFEIETSEFILRVARMPTRRVVVSVLVRRKGGTVVVDLCEARDGVVSAEAWNGLFDSLRDVAVSHMVVTHGLELSLPVEE